MIGAPCAYYPVAGCSSAYYSAPEVTGISSRTVRLGLAVWAGRSTECCGCCGVCSSPASSRWARVVRRGLAMLRNIIVVFTVVLDLVVTRALAVAYIL